MSTIQGAGSSVPYELPADDAAVGSEQPAATEGATEAPEDSARALYILRSNKREDGPDVRTEYAFRRPVMLLFSKEIETDEAAERLGNDKSVKARETRSVHGIAVTTTTKLRSAEDLATFLEIEDHTRTPTTSLAKLGRVLDRIEGEQVGQNGFLSLGVAKDGELVRGSGESFQRLSPLEAARHIEAGGSIAVVTEAVVKEKGWYGDTYLSRAISSTDVIATPEDLASLTRRYGAES